MKLVLSIAVASVAVTLLLASPVMAAESRRVFIVAGEGVDPVELIDSRRALGDVGGLASVRTGARADRLRAREAALATMLRGIRSTAFDGATPELLEDASRAKTPLIVLRGPGSISVPGAIEDVAQQPWDQERLRGSLAAAIERSRFVLVLLGPTGLDEIEQASDLAHDLADPSDAVFTLSMIPTERDFADRLWLGAIVASEGSGVLTSTTTGIHGVVSLLDVAPTVADALGLGELRSDGHLLEATGEGVDLAGMATGFRHATRIRHALTRGMLWAALAVFASSAVLLKAGSSRTPSFLSGSLLAAPLGMILEPIWGTRSLSVSVLVVIGVAAAGGVVASLKPVEGCLWIALTTVLVVIADLLVGEPLARYSVLSYSPIQGDRFHGIGNELMGVAIGSVLVIVALARGRGRRPAMVLMAVVTTFMALPTFGAKLGAVMTATPAFLAAGVVAGRGRLRMKTWITIGGATIVATAVIAAISALSSSPGHVGEAAGGGADLLEVLGRKAGAAARILRSTIWPRALAGMLAIVLVAHRYVPPVKQALGLEGPRAAAFGVAVAIVAAFVFNDAGAIAATLVTVVCAAALFATCVDVQRRERST